VTRGLLLALAVALAGCGEGGAGGEPGGAAKGGASPAGVAAGGAARAPDLSRANVVVISLDTLRADGVTVLGGPPSLSPVLDAFSRECVLFTQARSQAPHTAPSHMTLFTSTYPSVHGVQNVSFDKNEAGASKAVIVPLPKEIPTLAEVLSAAGLRSVGLTDGGNLNPPHGFGRGFEHYTYELAGVEAQVDDALPWIEKLTAPGAGRFFLFWHTYQVHAPYVPPEEYIARWAPADYDGLMKPRIEQLQGKTFKERFGMMRDVFWKDREQFGPPEARYLRGLYNGNVAFTDSQLQRLLDALRQHGVMDSSIIVVLSDHGEEFFEHGRWQHEQVYEECLRVPLMVRLPGAYGAGRRVDTPVGLIDVMPTLIELLGLDTGTLALPGPVRHDGQSFAPALLEGKEPAERPVISELLATRGGNYDWIVAIHYRGMSFLYDEQRGTRRPDKTIEHVRKLFDVKQDPLEQHDLLAQGGDKLKFFEEQHNAFILHVAKEQQGLTGSEALPVTDPAMLEQLEQLGYIQGLPAGGGAPKVLAPAGKKPGETGGAGDHDSPGSGGH
jgi:arylsulfatase A-like enzyme